MENFQKKISQMRQAINTIKLDLETMKSSNSNHKFKKSKSTTLMPLSTKLLNNNLNKIKRKSVFTHFRDNCPLKKEQLTKVAINTSVAINQNMTNYSKAKPYNFQYPLNKSNKEINQYGRLSDYMNVNHNNKQGTSLAHPSLKEKGRDKLFNLSPETKRISTNQSTISSQRQQFNQYNERIESFRRIKTRDTKAVTNSHRENNHRRHLSNNHRHINIYNETNMNNNTNNDMLNEIVDITNKEHLYTNGSIVTSNNFVVFYKKMIKQMKYKDEFINKLFLMHTNSSNKANKNDCNRDNDLVCLYKWIQNLFQLKTANKNKGNYYNERRKECSISPNDYQLLCEKIMKKYKLKDIRDLALFLHYLLKNANANDNFFKN